MKQTDKINEMEKAISHHIEVARLQMTSCCIQESPETQEKIADIWLVNRLAYEAMCHYAETWKKSGFKHIGKNFVGVVYTNPDRDPDIVKLSNRLSLELFGGGADVSERNYKNICLAMSILTKKIAEWIVADFNKELNEHTGN